MFGRLWVAPLALGVDDGGTASGRAGADAVSRSPAQPATPRNRRRSAAPAQAENPTFSAPAGLLLVQIKPDKTADYEAMIAKLKDARREEREAGAQGDGKGLEGLQGQPSPRRGNTLYVHVIDADGAWRLHQSAADHLGSVPDRGAATSTPR